MAPNQVRRMPVNRRFLLFFVSQGSVACSAFIQVVAVARLIMQITNSGLITGFGIVCAPLPGLIFSLFAGSLGDRFRAKNLLICFDLLRGLFVLLFMFSSSAVVIFCLMMAINLLDVLYSPSRNKLLTYLVAKEELIQGNSVLNGGYGAVSLVVPLATGLMMSVLGIRILLIIASACYLLSALFLHGLEYESHTYQPEKPVRQRKIAEGLQYCFNSDIIKRSIFTLSALDFGTAAVNIAFYSLVFDKLHIPSSSWGLILSVFYGMNIFSMALLYRYRSFFSGNSMWKVLLLLLIVTVVWLYYSTVYQLHFLLAGVAVEGFCSSLISTTLITRLQEKARKDYLARVMSIRDFGSSISKTAGIGLAFLLMGTFDVRSLFVTSAVLVLVFTAFQLLREISVLKIGIPSDHDGGF